MAKLTITILVALVFALAPAVAADHRDSPAGNEDPLGDINDVYAFVDPNDSSRVVLAMTVLPLVNTQFGGFSFGRAFLPD